MRICIDIDGTLCPVRQPHETYDELKPFAGAADALQSLKTKGAYIILHTARHMKTCNGNVGQVIAKQGKILIDWLARHNFKYDELLFGKPDADVYIDDKAVKYEGSWEDILKKIHNQ
jgi:capsule biosynthesis phosphatase